MDEWLKHVAKGHRKVPAHCDAYCGVRINRFDWSFVDAEHAVAAVEQNTRQQPCPECWEAMGEETIVQMEIADD